VVKIGQKGNALFLILIAVALFAALSYALTQSGRGSGTTAKEQAVLKAAEVSSFFGEIQAAISRLLLGGCSESQITFENSVYLGSGSGPYGGGLMLPPGSNAASPSDKRCHIFDTAGGGVVPMIIQGLVGPVPGGAWAIPGHPWFATESIPGVGTSAPDIVVSYAHVPESVCRAYGAANSRPTPITNADWYFVPPGQFAGSYTTGMAGGTEVNIPSGSFGWCIDIGGNADEWHLFGVVYAR
jgi:hypothetical protein